MAFRRVGGLCAEHKAWIPDATAQWQEEGRTWDTGPVLLLFLRWVCADTSWEKTYTVYVYCKADAPVQTLRLCVLCNATLRDVCLLSGLCLVGSVDVLGKLWRQPWSWHALWTRHAVWACCTSQLRHHTHTEQKRARLGPWFITVGGRSQKNLKGIENGLTCLSFSAVQIFVPPGAIRSMKPLHYFLYATHRTSTLGEEVRSKRSIRRRF